MRSSDILSPHTYHHYLPLCSKSDVRRCCAWPRQDYGKAEEGNRGEHIHWDTLRLHKPTTHRWKRENMLTSNFWKTGNLKWANGGVNEQMNKQTKVNKWNWQIN